MPPRDWEGVLLFEIVAIVGVRLLLLWMYSGSGAGTGRPDRLEIVSVPALFVAPWVLLHEHPVMLLEVSLALVLAGYLAWFLSFFIVPMVL